MQREQRYLVFKIDDIKEALDAEGQEMLAHFGRLIRAYRKAQGKEPDKQYVVVSEDWPMYEQTWLAIEKWVDAGAPVTPEHPDSFLKY